MLAFTLIVGILLCIGLLFLMNGKQSKQQKTHKAPLPTSKRNKKSYDEPEIKAIDPATLKLNTQLPTHFLSNTSDVFSKTIENMGNVLGNYEALQEQAYKLITLAEDASHPLMVVIMGEFKTGKSTFINALLKDEVVTTAVTPATAAVTMLCFGTKKEIIAYYHDGTNEAFQYEKLSAISAEGDPFGEAVRSKLSYLEVRLPHPMLKQLTIVDTPGLNADNPLHTKATEEFMDRADLVLWLFSYMNVGTKTAVSSLQKIDLEQKPIAIISQIDEYDEEEEDDTLEEFLQKSKQRLGNHVDRVLGVSALLAQDAREVGDEELWQESGWAQIEQLIDKEISAQSGAKKAARVLTKLKEILEDLNETVAGYKKQYDTADQQLHRHNEYVNNIVGQRQTLFNFMELFQDYAENNALAAMMEVKDLPDYAMNASSLNQYKQTLLGVLEGLIEEKEAIEQEFNANQDRIDNHNRNWSRLEEDFKEYNNSGLFGGRPIFDWDGKLKELNDRERTMGLAAEGLNEKKEELLQKDEARLARWSRANGEAYDLIQDIIENIQTTIEKFNDQVNNTDETMKVAEQELEQLMWLEHEDYIYSIIYWNLDLIITALERNMGFSKGDLLQEKKKIDPHMKFLIKSISKTSSSKAQAAATLETLSEEEVHFDLEEQLQTDAKVIQLNAGTYLLKEGLLIDHSVKLVGSETGATKIVSDTSGPVIAFAGDETELTGITFEYRGKAAANTVTVSSSSFIINNCYFTGGKIDEEEMARIYEDDFEKNPETGMGLSLRGTGKGTVNHCSFYGNIQGAMVNEHLYVEFINCQFYKNEIVGISFSNESKSVVKNSVFVDSLLGVGTEGESTVALTHNRFWGHQAAVVAADQSNLVVESNELVANSNGAIKVSDEAKLTATRNYISFNRSEGIGISDSASANIWNNSLNHHEYGIGSVGTTNVQIHGNLSEKNLQGVLFHKDVKGVIRKNKANDNVVNGILIGGNAQLTIEDNELLRNKTGILVMETNHAKLKVIRNIAKDNTNGFVMNDPTECSLEENRMESNKVGIFLCGNKPATLSRNICSKNEVGISLIEEIKPTLIANELEYNDKGIIYNDRSGGEATKNSFSHNEFGITVNGQATPTLRFNTVQSNKKDGIQVKHEAAPRIEQNKIIENGESGIVYFEQARGNVIKNDISRNKEWGIQFLDQPITEQGNIMAGNELGMISTE